MPAIERLLETFLVVERLRRACDFYRETLGLEPYGEPGERGCLFRLPGDQLLGLVAREAAAEANELPGGTVPAVLPPEGESARTADRPAARAHLAFAVAADQLDAWRRRLEENGVAVEGEVTWERGGRSLYFRDPDGHLLELATPGLWDFY